MTKRALWIITALAIANFTAFFVVAMVIGGDAVSGKIEGGRFFVANHGRFTEVSAGVFTYSLWHARSLLVTHPLGMLAGLFAYSHRKP